MLFDFNANLDNPFDSTSNALRGFGVANNEMLFTLTRSSLLPSRTALTISPTIVLAQCADAGNQLVPRRLPSLN